jgi:adenosylcobinamide kinase/adenosylcobinamide-phosphate guanylyltransferase
VSHRVLVLGGSRSGKSGFAESLLAGESAVDYVATAADRPVDAEWTERIRVHRERRASTWRTIETDDVAALLAEPGPAVLVDSVTLWLARALDRDDFAERADDLCIAWAGTPRRAVLVSDEVGSGVVPGTASGRGFRDALGLLNQRLATPADEVHLVVAGIALRLR